jgi:hypothetical protein
MKRNLGLIGTLAFVVSIFVFPPLAFALGVAMILFAVWAICWGSWMEHKHPRKSTGSFEDTEGMYHR